MNTQSIDCRRLPCPFPTRDLQPGDFCWGEANADGTRDLYIVLPGEKNPDAIRVQRGAPGGNRVWGWDGNEDQPTLQPSIHYVGHWHGYLRAGRLESC